METQGYSLFAFKFRLGFGIYIATENDRPLLENTKNIVHISFFDGLVIYLPFVEILMGTLWIPTNPKEIV